MRGKKIFVLLLALCFFFITFSASALTSVEKEAQYKAAVLELETYLEKGENSSEELAGIYSVFDMLSGYEQSRFLGYYVLVLQGIADENYDQMMILRLYMLENPVFEDYLKNIKGSVIRPAYELKLYAQAREYEYNRQIENALESYQGCLGFFDAAERYAKLAEQNFQETYDQAMVLLSIGDYGGAYSKLETIAKYKDSENYLSVIKKYLHSFPEEETTYRTEEVNPTEIRTSPNDYRIGRTVNIISSSASLRADPSLNAKKIGTVLRNQLYCIKDVQTSNDGMTWYQITVLGQIGWIASGVCEIK